MADEDDIFVLVRYGTEAMLNGAPVINFNLFPERAAWSCRFGEVSRKELGRSVSLNIALEQGPDSQGCLGPGGARCFNPTCNFFKVVSLLAISLISLVHFACWQRSRLCRRILRSHNG